MSHTKAAWGDKQSSTLGLLHTVDTSSSISCIRLQGQKNSIIIINVHFGGRGEGVLSAAKKKKKEKKLLLFMYECTYNSNFGFMIVS